MLQPIFNDAGISVYEVPHASSAALGYRVTLGGGGVIQDVEMVYRKPSVVDFQGKQNDGILGRTGGWLETGHGKVFQSPLAVGSSTGTLKLTDFGGSLSGNVNFEAPTLPVREISVREQFDRRRSMADIPLRRSLSSDDAHTTHPTGQHGGDFEPQSSSGLRLQRPQLSLEVGKLTINRPSFHLEKPQVWLEMEQKAG